MMTHGNSPSTNVVEPYKNQRRKDSQMSVGKLRRFFLGNLSFGGLAKRVWTEIRDDAIPSRAAELAFYLTMAFFPLLICLITLLALVPGTEGFLFGYLDTLLPKEAAEIVHGWVDTVFRHGSGGLLSVSLVFTLWSASAGVAALIDVLNVAYNVRERRPYWKYRLVALALTVGLAVLVIGGAVLFTFGSLALDFLADQFRFSEWLHVLTLAINYLVGLGMLFLGVSALYFFGPNVLQRWRFLTPGAVLAVACILGTSYLFSLYVQYAPSYSAVYGSIGAIVIFMLWLYLIGLMLLVGAEVNDEIQKSVGARLKERE